MFKTAVEKKKRINQMKRTIPMKKIITLLLTITMITGIMLPVAQADNSQITVTINNQQIQFDQPPVIIDGRTLVPLRAIFEGLGATVDWNGNTQTVIAIRSNTMIAISVGDNKLYVNENVVNLDVPAQIINDRTLVPVRAVSEAFDCEVHWDGNTKTVSIRSENEENNDKYGWRLSKEIYPDNDLYDETNEQKTYYYEYDEYGNLSRLTGYIGDEIPQNMFLELRFSDNRLIYTKDCLYSFVINENSVDLIEPEITIIGDMSYICEYTNYNGYFSYQKTIRSDGFFDKNISYVMNDKGEKTIGADSVFDYNDLGLLVSCTINNYIGIGAPLSVKTDYDYDYDINGNPTIQYEHIVDGNLDKRKLVSYRIYEKYAK